MFSRTRHSSRSSAPASSTSISRLAAAMSSCACADTARPYGSAPRMIRAKVSSLLQSIPVTLNI